MSDVEDLLSQLGLGEDESRAYIAVPAHAPVTGSEPAKSWGIPQANGYAALQKPALLFDLLADAGDAGADTRRNP